MLNETRNGDMPHIDHEDFPAIIVITCILSVFSVIGVTGNAFVLYIFFRKKDKSTSTVFILTLAATDLFTSLFIMPYTIAVEFMYKKVNDDIACKVYQFMITSSVPFSAFIMVAIAFDRYFCICRPWMKLFDIKLAKRIILSLFIFAISLGLITCLVYGVHHFEDVIIYPMNSTNFTNEITFPTIETVTITAPYAAVSAGTFAYDVTDTTSRADNISFGVPNMLNMSNFTREIPGKNDSVRITRIVYTGFCLPNELILGSKIRRIYQTFYASLFLITFIIVFILYALIYKSILSRRSKKLRTSVSQRHFNGRRSTMLTSFVSKPSHVQDKSTMTANNLRPDVRRHSRDVSIAGSENGACASPTDVSSLAMLKPRGSVSSAISECNNSTPMHELLSPHRNHFSRLAPPPKVKKTNIKFREKYHQLHFATEVPIINQETSQAVDPAANDVATITIYRKDTRKSVREKNRIANIKTAGILFIVTLVFIVAFLPSWLMAIRVIPANMVVFYMYFSYNVANPVIYAFCNHAFQNEVRKMLKCRTLDQF